MTLINKILIQVQDGHPEIKDWPANKEKQSNIQIGSSQEGRHTKKLPNNK